MALFQTLRVCHRHARLPLCPPKARSSPLHVTLSHQSQSRARTAIKIERDLPSAWRSSLSWTAQFQLKTNQVVQDHSGRTAARTPTGMLNVFLLVYFRHSVLVSTVFQLVFPLSTVTAVTLKLGVVFLFTFVLCFALVIALLALVALSFLSFASIDSIDFH